MLYKQNALDAPGEVLLDPNGLSTDGTASLSTYALTDDGELLAYGISQGGSDWVTVHVRNVATATDLPDKLSWVKFSGLAWTDDNKGFFYSVRCWPLRLRGQGGG